MKSFEYAEPRTEAEVVDFLNSDSGSAVVLAGGTDLVGLMKSMVVTPDRVVNIMEVPSLKQIIRDEEGNLYVGAAVTLDEVLASSDFTDYGAITDGVLGINSMQLQAQGTLGGELCQRPNCWFFRSGNHSLLDGATVAAGDNRFHAIFGNAGPAKYVSSSRLAPAMMVLDAYVRIVGPNPDNERYVPIADFFQMPRHQGQGETILEPGQFVTHIVLPPASAWYSATYEVRHGEGPDVPLAAAAAAIEVRGGTVQNAQVVLGHVAPIPWSVSHAADFLCGKSISPEVAEQAGNLAVRDASPLSQNEYKVQLAKTAVKRAILRAAGLDIGGF